MHSPDTAPAPAPAPAPDPVNPSTFVGGAPPDRVLTFEEELAMQRLYIDPTSKSPDALLVYVIEDGDRRPRWAFTVYSDDLADAHAAKLEVGAHPYAAVTLAHAPASIKYERPGLRYVSDCVGASLVAIGDWMDWCDAVWAEIQLQFDDDAEGHEEPDDGVLDSSVYLAAMVATWRVEAQDGARVADLPTDEEDDAAAAAEAVRGEAVAP